MVMGGHELAVAAASPADAHGSIAAQAKAVVAAANGRDRAPAAVAADERTVAAFAAAAGARRHRAWERS
jgi:hypothetical protein